VEGVDVERRALERQAYVLTHERSGLRQRLDSAVEVDVAILELAPAAARVRKERTDTAGEVEPGIAARRSGGVGEVVERFLVRGQVLSERREPPRPFVNGQPAQRRPTHRAGVLER